MEIRKTKVLERQKESKKTKGLYYKWSSPNPKKTHTSLKLIKLIGMNKKLADNC